MPLHEPRRVMVDASVDPLVHDLMSERPDLVINLAESFAGKSALESNIAALLNLLDLRYTGSSPAGLLVAGDKTLSKKVLVFHGIKTPQFVTVYRGMVDWPDVEFPLIVKPQEDASLGITHRSIVRDVKELLEKIASSRASISARSRRTVRGRPRVLRRRVGECKRACPSGHRVGFLPVPCGQATNRQLGGQVGR